MLEKQTELFCPECQRKDRVDIALMLPAEPPETAWLCPQCNEYFRTGSDRTCEELRPYFKRLDMLRGEHAASKIGGTAHD